MALCQWLPMVMGSHNSCCGYQWWLWVPIIAVTRTIIAMIGTPVMAVADVPEVLSRLPMIVDMRVRKGCYMYL